MFPFRGRGGFSGFPVGPRFPMGGMGMPGGIPMPMGGMPGNMPMGFGAFNNFNGHGMRPFMHNNFGAGGPPGRGGMGGRGGRGGITAGTSQDEKKNIDKAEPSTSAPEKIIVKTEETVSSEVAVAVVKSEVVTVKKATALPGENEPDFDDTLCLLDWYNSDLNLKIATTDFCSAEAMSNEAFGYMWGGSRATYGATRGRVCFEVRVDGNQPTHHLEGEESPNVLRVGWSVSGGNLQLGEVKNSFGYGGTGKAAENCVFKNYGCKFGVGDVVGCFLDMSGENCTIKFTVNGRDQGIGFRFTKKDLQGNALFPHVLTKNQNFTVNFGQMTAPLFPLLTGYTPIGQLEVSDGLVRGPLPPPSRAECEVLMMIGLPGAGKTFWAEKYAKENESKNYNILGTNNLIEKMKVNGLSRKRNYHGRWEVLIKKCTECFNTILDLAAKRRRNYILDQTNVFPTARGRKLKDFKGFNCKAVTVVTTDEEFRRRVAEREAVEGKEIPDNAVLNMKSNFVLPELEETFFSEVWYTELPPEEAHKVVNGYNEEARTSGLTIMQGVRSFKFRNENKRREQNIPLPGKHVKVEKGLKPVEVSKGPEEKVQASTSSFSSQEKGGPDVKPELPSRVAELKREGKEPSKKSSRSRSRSRDRRGSKDRRRSRSRDRRSSPSRDKSRSERSRRSRSGDRKYDGKDKGRKRSRSRTRDRDRDRSNQKIKKEISPWLADTQFDARGQSARGRDIPGTSRGTGSFRPNDRPNVSRDLDAPGTSRMSDLGKNDPVKIEKESESFQDSSFRGGFHGRGRGRGGRGSFDTGPSRGRGYQRGQASSHFSDVRENSSESGRAEFPRQEGELPARKDGDGPFMSRPGSRASQEASVGRRGPAPGILGDFPPEKKPLVVHPDWSGPGPSKFSEDRRGNTAEGQMGNNQFFNNRNNFGPDVQHGPGKPGFPGRPGPDRGLGPVVDNRLSADGPGRGKEDWSDEGRNRNWFPQAEGGYQNDEYYGGDEYMDNAGETVDASIPIPNIDDEFATRMERRLQAYEDEQQEQYNTRDGQRGSYSGNFGRNSESFNNRNKVWDESQGAQDYGENFNNGGRFNPNSSHNDFGSNRGAQNFGPNNRGSYGPNSGSQHSGPFRDNRGSIANFNSRGENFGVGHRAALDAPVNINKQRIEVHDGGDDFGTSRDGQEHMGGRGGFGPSRGGPDHIGGRGGFGPSRDGPEHMVGRGGYGPSRGGPEHIGGRGGFGPSRGGQEHIGGRGGFGPSRGGPEYIGGRGGFGPSRGGPEHIADRGGFGPSRGGTEHIGGRGSFGSRDSFGASHGGPGNTDFVDRAQNMTSAPPPSFSQPPGFSDPRSRYPNSREETEVLDPHQYSGFGNRPIPPVDAPPETSRVPPKIPNWDSPAQVNDPIRVRDDRFPITSDGKGVGMGYSVQYHSESYERMEIGYRDKKEPGTLLDNRRGFQTPEERFASDLSQSSRLNIDGNAIPGMNPPAPDQNATPGGAVNPTQSTSGPDYAALLQYLQFYQKQMGTEETRK